ncbi:MAG: ATP-grasp domain-containing protein [Methylococcales bacterium]|nr:ATP-grasp domain-containing protein [Methylococcales bacterium]MDD5754483.1 ATP-grasp domain-containing protein [Methylococcales bacterium]
MKVLIFEYITANGEASKSLAREGQMMVEALLSNFVKLSDVETVLFPAEKNVEIEFQKHIKNVDAVWVIAPEFDGILGRFCRYVEDAHKRLLTSPSKAVALTANKLTTFQILHAAKIQTVPTEVFNPEFDYDKTKEWIIKPIDGVGAENTFLLTTEKNWTALPSLEKKCLIQPHLHGEKTSLSCLFKNGEARLLCVNLQIFEVKNQQYVLQNIDVNYKLDDGRYQKLATQIALAFPDLFGYVGVDLIETDDVFETDDVCFVLEINPRLTTSFVGIEKALGLNVAELVLAL